MEEYLTPEDAADVLRISRRTCYNYLREGYIKAWCPSGRWLITEQAIKDFAEGRSGGPRAGRGPNKPKLAPAEHLQVAPLPVPLPQVAKQNPLANRKNKRR